MRRNGRTPRIQAVKAMLHKILEDKEEIPLTLLNFPNITIIEILSPDELLMDRNLRAPIPVSQKQLRPRPVHYSCFNKYLIKREQTPEHIGADLRVIRESNNIEKTCLYSSSSNNQVHCKPTTIFDGKNISLTITTTKQLSNRYKSTLIT